MRKLRPLAETYDHERDILLTDDHHGWGHRTPVPGCPVCYNVAIVDVRVAAGEPVPSFELDTILPSNTNPTPRRRRKPS